MSKTKKTKNSSSNESAEYYDDIKKAEELLFYKKNEIIKYLNKKVPFVVFPSKYMKIEDISFTIADFGKVFIHLYLNDDDTTIITSKNGSPIHYDPPGLITVGPGLEYKKTFIKRTEEVLNGYLQILEVLKSKYPEKNIYFGRDNSEYIERISSLEKPFYRKLI